MMMQEQPMLDSLNGPDGHHGGLIDRRLVESGHLSHHSMDDEPQHILANHHQHHLADAGSPPNIGMWPPNHLMMGDGGEPFVGGHHTIVPHHPDMIGGSSASSSSGSSVSAGPRCSPPLVGGPGPLGSLTGSRKQSSSAAAKKGSSRRNAWGNLSYADLITQAIQSAPEKRLTLSQVYEWMVANIPYFKDKGDSNSSAGWKNSIRHNLSLHSRFVRVQNEGTGKSSWWMLNPDAKPGGKTSRRRTPSVDGAGNPIGPRGIDYKRRGRSKKPGGTAIRNGNLGNGSTPSPGLPPGGGPHPGLHGMDLYEDPRALHSQYPFATDLRSHLGGGGGEYAGRMSPPPNLRGEGPFGYPGQESWPSEYQACGMQGYFPGNIPRSFCDQICPDSDYNCPRPGSPSALIQARANGSVGYRHYPTNGVGDNFHHFSSHEGKMPGSPIVGIPPHSLAQDCTPHSYSNIQVMSPGVPPNMSPSCQRPTNFPSPDPPSQSTGEPPMMSPHPLHHGGGSGQAFFPNCGMGGKPPQNESPPPPSTPTSKACTNASILERALGNTIKQEHHVVTSAVMSAQPGQWSHLTGHGHPNYSEVDDFMKTEGGLENIDFMYQAQGGGQNVSPSMAHLPPPPHTPGSRSGEGGQYHHTLSNWVR